MSKNYDQLCDDDPCLPCVPPGAPIPFDNLQTAPCQPVWPCQSTSTTTTTTTQSTSSTSTTTAGTPCQSTLIGTVAPSINSNSISTFGVFNAGLYYVQYAGGCLQYNPLNQFFQVNNFPAGAGFSIAFSGGASVLEAPGNSLGYMDVSDLESANIGQSVAFEHAGGSIGVFMWDPSYSNNVGGPTGSPKFQLYYSCLNSSTTTVTTSSSTSSTSSSTTTPQGTFQYSVCVTNNSPTGFGAWPAGTYRIVYESGMMVAGLGADSFLCGLLNMYVTWDVPGGSNSSPFPNGSSCSCNGDGIAGCLTQVQEQAGQLSVIITIPATDGLYMWCDYTAPDGVTGYGTGSCDGATFNLYSIP